MKHIKHVKYVLLADKYTQHLPDYSAFRRKTTLQMNPDHIPDCIGIWQVPTIPQV